MLHPTVGNLSFFSTVDDGKSEQSSCVAPFFQKAATEKERPSNWWTQYRSVARAEYELARERDLSGSRGAASPVRKIDPTTREMVEIIEPH
jgi:hypothetical protein